MSDSSSSSSDEDNLWKSKSVQNALNSGAFDGRFLISADSGGQVLDTLRKSNRRISILQDSLFSQIFDTSQSEYQKNDTSKSLSIRNQP